MTKDKIKKGERTTDVFAIAWATERNFNTSNFIKLSFSSDGMLSAINLIFSKTKKSASVPA